MSKENPDVTFIGVAAHDTETEMTGFISATGVGVFPNINDADLAIWARYGIGYQPAFVFVAADGSTETYASLNESDIQAHIDELF